MQSEGEIDALMGNYAKEGRNGPLRSLNDAREAFLTNGGSDMTITFGGTEMVEHVEAVARELRESVEVA